MRTRNFLSFALAALLGGPVLVEAAEAPELASVAKAVDDNPDDAKAYEAYATQALGLGRLDDAIVRLKVGVARIGGFTNGYYLLAYAYRKKQAWADAADFYRVCISLKLKENESLFGLGQSLAGLGDKKGAVGALKQYVAAEKRPAAKKFVDEANVLIAKLEGPALPAPEAASLRAQADGLRKEKKLEEAAAAYKKAIEADRANLDLYNDLGNVYFGLKKYDDAAQAFRDAVGRDQGYALGWYNLAHALRKANRNQEAVDAYGRYMKLKPEDPDAWYGLGQTYKALGDPANAVQAFRRYIDAEKRPDQQKWVEKARTEMQLLEAAQKPAQGAPGKIDDK